MTLQEFLDLEIPDATSVLANLQGDIKLEWHRAYLSQHQYDLLDPRPHHVLGIEPVGIKIPMVTISDIPGREIVESIGIVLASCVYGAHIFKDVGAELVNIFGGRANGYETTMTDAGSTALTKLMGQAVELGADAVVGVRIDFGTTGATGGILMASASGTAVRLAPTCDSSISSGQPIRDAS